MDFLGGHLGRPRFGALFAYKLLRTAWARTLK